MNFVQNMKTAKLRKQVFESALKIVESQGIEELNARKLAELSSCALGSIYNAFGDLDDLRFHINATILSRLYERLYQTVEQGISKDVPLLALFKELGVSYIEFAKGNPLLWKTLFEYAPSVPVPDWYEKRAGDGIDQLCQRLYVAYGISKEKAQQLIGFFWASVHGICAILLNNKMDMVSDLFQDGYLEDFIEYSLTGLFKSRSDEMKVPTKG